MKNARKNEFNPVRKLVTGAPRAVVVSVLVHVGLLVLAAILVVIRIPPREVEVLPDVIVQPAPPEIPLPPPPMPSNKPQSTPSPAPITADVDDVDPEQITALDRPPGSTGDSDRLLRPLEKVWPSFEGVDISPITTTGNPIGTELKGVYYDFKRSRSGNYTGAGAESYRDAVRRFLNNDWSPTALSSFYHSPEPRFTSCIMLPTSSSSVAPEAFGEDPGSGAYWMVHYKGSIVYPEDITFRFWGVGDEFLIVRMNKEIVFADVWPSEWDAIMGSLWHNPDSQSKTYLLGHDTTMGVGDWITLKAGEPMDIEIAVGDNGGLAALMLLVEVDGVDYPQNRQGGPILPAFKTAMLSHDILDMIYKDLAPGEACLTNGPVFNDIRLSISR